MSKHIEHSNSQLQMIGMVWSLKKVDIHFDFMFCPHRMKRRSHLNSIIMKLR